MLPGLLFIDKKIKDASFGKLRLFFVKLLIHIFNL